MKIRCLIVALSALAAITGLQARAELAVTHSPAQGDFTLADGQTIPAILVDTNDNRAVLRAAHDLAEDFSRVTGTNATLVNQPQAGATIRIIAGTLGHSEIIDRLAASDKLDTKGLTGAWESYTLQLVKNPAPGIDRALVIAGSDRRGTIYGIYQLSELIGVSPWYWWADVPVKHQTTLALHGNGLKQGPPAVKYRGIFLNDEDWALRPWASKTFDPATGNIGPKTYAKVFELLLRLHANYLWPAMHPGTSAFNSYPDDAPLADEYGIVMGASHCEQMLRNNISEWDETKYGDYNFVTNPDGVLRYWEDRVRANGKYENVYTLGMRGIHDSGMPGGGTEHEKAARLETIVADQRDMLARNVSSNVASIPQIFCPYKEVLPLYRLMKNLPDDITLCWPDDNYGYIRQFSDAKERQRSGGAGVYYHVSYYGAPRDYLWLCSTPPALIAEEMTKAFDYGADKVWILNVGDLKPAELDIDFFLKLGWNPHAWNGINTYDLFQTQIMRDFGGTLAPEITGIMAEYYRLNFERKPEHVGFPGGTFSAGEISVRLAAWKKLADRTDALAQRVPPELQDAYFELVAYPVKSAAAANRKYLAEDSAAVDEIHQLTDHYNQKLTGGKWQLMMSDNPRKQVDVKVTPPVSRTNLLGAQLSLETIPPSGKNFVEMNRAVVLEAEDASEFVPGKDARWQKIDGLGYNGGSVMVSPATAPINDTPEKIQSASPCLRFQIDFTTPGAWQFAVRALPTFSVDTGQPQRYAIALDNEPPKIVALPLSQDEHNHIWQENVLRNAAITSSIHTVAGAGRHTLKIWMVDPGIVLDAIEAQPASTATE